MLELAERVGFELRCPMYFVQLTDFDGLSNRQNRSNCWSRVQKRYKNVSPMNREIRARSHISASPAPIACRAILPKPEPLTRISSRFRRHSYTHW